MYYKFDLNLIRLLKVNCESLLWLRRAKDDYENYTEVMPPLVRHQ